jgi:hypothetical protein
MSDIDSLVDILSNEISNSTEEIRMIITESKEASIVDSLTKATIGITDTEEFIKKFNLKPVTSINIFSGDAYDPSGLFSERIFGFIGTSDRRTRFGYIDFSNFGEFLQPPIIYTISRYSSKLFDAIVGVGKNVRYMKFIESRSELVDAAHNEEGAMSGYDLAKFVVDNVNLIKNLGSTVSKVLKNAGRLAFTKYILVIPPDLRPIVKVRNITSVDKLNDIYRTLVQYSLQYAHLERDSYWNMIWKNIQNKILQYANELIDDKLAGKEGLIRSSVLSKRMDYNVSGVVSNNPNLEVWQVGIPYHMIAKMAQHFIIHVIFNKNSKKHNKPFKELFKEAGVSKLTFETASIMLNDFSKKHISDEKLNSLIEECIDIAVHDKYVLVKRDPSLHRDSWMSYKLVPISKEYNSIHFPPLASKPHNLDYDGDSVSGESVVKLYNNYGELVFNDAIQKLVS